MTLVALFELCVLENQMQFNISIFLSVLQNGTVDISSPPLIPQTGCVAKRTVRDVVTDNRGDASLSGSLAINNAEFVRHKA